MKTKNRNETIVIICPNKECNQKLRIPKQEKNIRFICPRCRKEYIYPFEAYNGKKTSSFLKKIKDHPIFSGLVITFWILVELSMFRWRTLSLKNSFYITIFFLILWLVGTWIIENIKEKETKWYFRKWFVVLMLFFLAPVGITLLWAGSKFKKPFKIGFTIVFGLWFVLGALTRTNERLYFSPEDEVAKLFRSSEKNIFLKLASRNEIINFQQEFLSSQDSQQSVISTIPQIAQKWGESIVLVQSKNNNGEDIGQGSGFVITSNGAIVTNYHVIESARKVSITFINRKSYENVSLITGSPEKDIIILSINEKDNKFLPVILGNSNDLQVGERVVAVGNPYGWENTLSDGLISGIREIEDIKLLQITAPISPGSSGGALFNMKGEVIGITTISTLWGAQNLNFAIPINSLKFIIKKERVFN